MAIFAAALGLGGCEPSGQAAGTAPGEDRYAGLDSAIKTWHAEIKATDAQCKDKAEAQKCQAFEVACKGEREVTPGEAAKGVSAKVAVAMGWEGWDAARSEYQPESTVAEFQKVGGAWKRLPTGPVNLSTCVPS
jgi:hypothetical protein